MYPMLIFVQDSARQTIRSSLLRAILLYSLSAPRVHSFEMARIGAEFFEYFNDSEERQEDLLGERAEGVKLAIDLQQ